MGESGEADCVWDSSVVGGGVVDEVAATVTPGTVLFVGVSGSFLSREKRIIHFLRLASSMPLFAHLLSSSSVILPNFNRNFLINTITQTDTIDYFS